MCNRFWWERFTRSRSQSFVWVRMREVLPSGILWSLTEQCLLNRFGDWRSIRIGSFKVISPKVRDDVVKVSQLRTVSGGRNVPLINDMFVPADSTAILSIPPSSTQMEDTLCWHYNPSGNYSIKSGYKTIVHTLWDCKKLKEVRCACSFSSRLRWNDVVGYARWQLPSEGYFKLNMDVALDVDRNLVGVGVVVRHALGAITLRLDTGYTPQVVKVVAVCD
ncbi:hypothetical protein Q3G72_011308 [Acer saccharum]|nr:hypothetical protein Q3G72_011308 [Acer saccharum]